MIDHLDHLVLSTTDEATYIDFYTRVLGMTVERFEAASGGMRLTFRFGDQKINLTRAPPIGGAQGSTASKEPSMPRAQSLTDPRSARPLRQDPDGSPGSGAWRSALRDEASLRRSNPHARLTLQSRRGAPMLR